MRVVLGIVTIVAAAAGASVWLAPNDGEFAVVSGIDAAGVARLSAPGSQRVEQPAKATSVVLPVAQQNSATANGSPRFFGSAVPAQRPPLPAAAPPPQTAAMPATGWGTDVVIYPAGRPLAAEAAIPAVRVVAKPPSAAPVPPRDRPRTELVRELQRELKRVGCYVGDVDGEWGVGSRRSMRAFMDQVSSSLQSDDPDLIQLTLVRGYSGTACRNVPGQAPELVTARRTPLAPPTGPSISIANRQPAPAPAYASGAPNASASTAAANTAGEAPLPSAARVVPLEGRMAMGAPVSAADLNGHQPVPGLVDPAAAAAAAARAAKPRENVQRSAQRRSNWTSTFFNQ